MTRLELDKRILKAGWTIEHGSNHDLAISPTGQKVPLPRHRGDIPIGTLRRILKDVGLS